MARNVAFSCTPSPASGPGRKSSPVSVKANSIPSIRAESRLRGDVVVVVVAIPLMTAVSTAAVRRNSFFNSLRKSPAEKSESFEKYHSSDASKFAASRGLSPGLPVEMLTMPAPLSAMISRAASES